MVIYLCYILLIICQNSQQNKNNKTVYQHQSNKYPTIFCCLILLIRMLQYLGNTDSNSNDGVYSTNQVLIQPKPNRTLYYLPCYVRFKVKQISSLDIQGLQGVVSGTLLFSFYYGALDRHIVDQFVGDGDKAILLQFSRQESLQLKQDKGIIYKQDQKAKIIDFVVRQDFNCTLQGDVFYTPFEIINLFLTVTVQSVVLDPKNNNGQRIDIKFNCMHSDEVLLLGHSQNCNFGNYRLANHFLAAAYKNSGKNPFPKVSTIHQEYQQITAKAVAKVHDKSKINLDDSKQFIISEKGEKSKTELQLVESDKQDEKVKHFQYIHFRIPLYKYPGVSLVSIFLPIWILGFINLLIFFQQPSLSGRIAAIATLTLAFIAFIPTINQKIPQTPRIKLIQILVYSQTIASILCLIQSLIQFQNNNVSPYTFNWQQNGWFITALIINLSTVAVVLVLFVIHKVFWEKIYVKDPPQGKKLKLNRKNWNNRECDNQFQNWINNKKIRVI